MSYYKVIPVQTGIYIKIDPRLRGDDKNENILLGFEL